MQITKEKEIEGKGKKMEFREFSAKTVDEAITKASLEFEVSSENLEIQIVSEEKQDF